MKTLLLLFSGLSTLTAFANSLPSEDSSWDAIRANGRVQINEPTVRLNHSFGLARYSVLDTCLDHGTVFLKNHATVEVCVRKSKLWKGISSCVEYAQVTPSAASIAQETYCTKWVREFPKAAASCVQQAEAKVDYSLPMQVDESRCSARWTYSLHEELRDSELPVMWFVVSLRKTDDCY